MYPFVLSLDTLRLGDLNRSHLNSTRIDNRPKEIYKFFLQTKKQTLCSQEKLLLLVTWFSVVNLSADQTEKNIKLSVLEVLHCPVRWQSISCTAVLCGAILSILKNK